MTPEPLPYAIRLVAGAIAQRLPERIHALMLDLAMTAMIARHACIFDRLASLKGSSLAEYFDDSLPTRPGGMTLGPASGTTRR
jgi:hypothetical protein